MAQHSSSLLPSVDGVIPAPINWRTDMEQGFLVTGRRSVRVPSNIPGPFSPNGQRQIVITTQSLSDELMDTSTLRLKFDYRAVFGNTSGPSFPAPSGVLSVNTSGNSTFAGVFFVPGVTLASIVGQGQTGFFTDPGHSIYGSYGGNQTIPYNLANWAAFTSGNGFQSPTGPINGYGGANAYNTPVVSGSYGSGALPFYNILDDGGLSWVRSITVSIGNQVVETVDKYNVLCNWLVYNTAKRDWLFTQGVAAGYWLDYMAATPSQTGSQSPFCNISCDGAMLLLTNSIIRSANGPGIGYPLTTDIPAPARNCAGGMTLVCPLFCLAITRTRKLQAFKYWRGLQITIDLEDWERCHTLCDAQPNNGNPGRGLIGYPSLPDYGNPLSSPWNPTIVLSPGFTIAEGNVLASTITGAAITFNPSYQISNVYLLYDLVAPSSDFAAQLEKLALSEGAGMAFKFDAWATQTTQRTGCIQNSTITFTNSVSYTKVKSLFAVFRDANVTALPAQPFKTGTFIFPGLINYQWQVGSRRFPDFQTGDSTGWPVAAGATGVSMDTAYGSPSMAWRSGLTETYSYLKDALGEYNSSDSSGGVVSIGNFYKPVPFLSNMEPVISTTVSSRPIFPTPVEPDQTTLINATSNWGSFGRQFFQYIPVRFSIGLNMQVLNDAMLGADLRSTAPNTQLTITLGGDPSSADQQGVWAAKVLEYILIVWYDMYITIRGGVVGISK